MRSRFLTKANWTVGVLAVAWLFVTAAQAATRAERTRAAAQMVDDALQQEVQGTNDQRSTLLESALEQLPEYPPALWHSGYVLDRKKWRKYDELAARLARETRLAAYRRMREKTPESIEGQLALAAWCGERRLGDQQRAHLTKVLELDPDHVEARRQLGYRFVDGQWMTDEEIAQATRLAQQAAAAMRQWGPKLLEIRAALGHRSQPRRQAAVERLLAIDDPSAVGPMEAMLSRHDEQTALLMVEALSAMKAREASLVLARQGAFSPWEEVRYTAAKRLGSRDLHTFVPELLASMGAPIVSRAELYRAPTGRLLYRHTFLREGQDQNQVAILDTEYRDSTSSPRSQMARAQQAHAARNALRREAAVARQNEAIWDFNERVCSVLNHATGEQLPDVPDQWWKWWNDYNEVYTVGEKPVRGYYNRDQLSFTDSSGGGRSSYECLVAGTPVWTEAGPLPVEQVRIGDCVLAQHPETGELAYKPVLRTTQRDPEQLLELQVGDHLIRCTGGHPFWVPGEGWVKARHLEPGTRLHAVAGAHAVDSVEQTGFEPTYNLIVADFHTYFVGEDKIFTHDNTIREPTGAVVPGLIEQ